VILVLDGDNNDVRLQRALNLLRAGYGKAVLRDERADQVQFGPPRRRSSLPATGRIASTAEEVTFAAPCVASRHAHRI